MPQKKFRLDPYISHSEGISESRAEYFGPDVTRRTVLRIGAAGIGAALASPSLADVGSIRISYSKWAIEISDARFSWNLDSRWFGKNCSLRVRKTRKSISAWIVNGLLPATDLPLNLFFQIDGIRTENPTFLCRSRQLGIRGSLSLGAWLRGEATFSGLGERVTFAAVADSKTSVSGYITHLSRDWEIALDNGAISSAGRFHTKASALQIGRGAGKRLGSGLIVKCADGVDFDVIAPDGHYRGTKVRWEQDARANPNIRLAWNRVAIEFRSTHETNTELGVELDSSIRLSLQLFNAKVIIGLANDNETLEMHGLVGSEFGTLNYDAATFKLRSSFANEVFSLSAFTNRDPEFGHRFTVESSALPVKGSIAGYARPSSAQEIWIGDAGSSPGGDFSMMLSDAGGSLLPGGNEISPLELQQVCAGCSTPGKPQGISYFTTRIHQPESLLELRIEFYNFDLETREGIDRLAPREVPGACLIIVHFGPQHIEEDAFNEGAGCEGEAPGPGPNNIPIGANSAAPARLVFEYPKSLGPLELNLDSILDWEPWQPRSSGVTRHPLLINPPNWDEPAIEAPRGLVLQQGPDTRWRANGFDGVLGQSHVLFNVDLLSNQLFDPDEPDLQRRPRMVPVWTDAFVECGVVPPQPSQGMWRTVCQRINLGGNKSKNECEVLSPSSKETKVGESESGPVKVIEETTLRAVVRLGHDSTLCPEPFKAEHMLLTQLGAWTALDGYWPKTPARGKYTDLKSKKHRITQGRTQFDKDERRGFLYPFGHRVTLVAETNRRQHDIGEATYSALKKKWYVVVEQPTVDTGDPRLFEDRTDQSFRMPFRSVRIVESSTPNLDPPDIEFITEGNECNTYFWGHVCKQQFFFNVVGSDWRGREISFKVPLLFVNDVALDEDNPVPIGVLNDRLEAVFKDANRHIPISGGGNGIVGPISTLSRSFADFSGQLVALQNGYQEGDTDFEICRLRFTGERQLPPSTKDKGDCELIVDGPTENTAYFYPVVEVAEARAPTLSRATADGGGACWLSIVDPTNDPSEFEIVAVQHASASVPDGSLARINLGQYPQVTFKLPFDKNSDSTGGVAGPTPDIDAWSRIKGPLGIGTNERLSLSGVTIPEASTAEFRNGRLNPSSYFNLDAKICGVIPLSEIVGLLGLDSTTPALLDFFNDGGDIADSTGFVYDWDTPLNSWDSGILSFGPRTEGGPAKLVITGGVLIELEEDPSLTGFIRGDITDFFISLEAAGNGIRADFARIGLNAKLGEKIEFDVDIETVAFIGPLMEFIQKLKEQLGFGDGFDVVLSAKSVTAQLGPFELPSIGFGVFSMSQISFFAGCDIYFKGNKPILFTFKFSTRDRPFSLAVALLGGRGSFLIALDTTGVQEIAASLEFGAVAEFAFGGFAHGNLYIMGGVFYSSKRVVVTKTGASGGQLVEVSETIISVEIYVRAGGSLSCFGFITVSLDVHLGLNIVQRAGNSVAFGTATLTFSVKIGFFKKSFSVTFSKELPGSQSDSSNQRELGDGKRVAIAAFQNELSPASPFTPYSTPKTKAASGLEASPAQVTAGQVFAQTCDHRGDTCGPSGISAMSEAQFRYYWYSFGENRRKRF